jgi:hypothetical protein
MPSHHSGSYPRARDQVPPTGHPISRPSGKVPHGPFWGYFEDTLMFWAWVGCPPLPRARMLRMGPLEVTSALTPPW